MIGLGGDTTGPHGGDPLTGRATNPMWLEEPGDSIFLSDSPSKTSEEKNIREKIRKDTKQGGLLFSAGEAGRPRNESELRTQQSVGFGSWVVLIISMSPYVQWV